MEAKTSKIDSNQRNKSDHETKLDGRTSVHGEHQQQHIPVGAGIRLAEPLVKQTRSIHQKFDLDPNVANLHPSINTDKPC
jgi:hypothetical protein